MKETLIPLVINTQGKNTEQGPSVRDVPGLHKDNRYAKGKSLTRAHRTPRSTTTGEIKLSAL